MKNFTKWSRIFGSWTANAEYEVKIPLYGNVKASVVSTPLLFLFFFNCRVLLCLTSLLSSPHASYSTSPSTSASIQWATTPVTFARLPAT